MYYSYVFTLERRLILSLSFFFGYNDNYLGLTLCFLCIEVLTTVLYFFLNLTINGQLEFLKGLYTVDNTFPAKWVPGLLIIIERNKGLLQVFLGFQPLIVGLFNSPDIKLLRGRNVLYEFLYPRVESIIRWQCTLSASFGIVFRLFRFLSSSSSAVTFVFRALHGQACSFISVSTVIVREAWCCLFVLRSFSAHWC